LKEWVRDEAEAARIYRRLAEAAMAYRTGEGGLLDDVTLQWVFKWRDKYAPNRAWAVRYHPEFEEALRYLNESSTARDAAVAERERQREEQIERERRELAQAQRYAEQQHQAALRLRVLVRSLGVISIIAVVAVIATLVMAWRANTARHGVEAARQKLQTSRTALKLIQSYEMEEAEKELNEFYRLTANDEEGHENKAWVLYNLGDLNRRLERNDQAAAFFESALETEIMIHGKLGLESVGTVDSLAHTLADQGNYAVAVSRQEQLADLLNSVADQKGRYFRLNAANVHSDLANLYLRQARAANKVLFPNLLENDERILEVPEPVRDKARAEYRKAVSIWEQVLKEEPAALADRYLESAKFLDESLGGADPEDREIAARWLNKRLALRRTIISPLARKPIGPPNPGGDPGINTQLAPEGTGYTVFGYNAANSYGRPELNKLITSVAAAWAARHPNFKLVVGDLSRQGGGPLPPHGGDHQDGREVDIWAVAINGISEPTNIFAPNYSRDLTTELIKLIQQTNPNAVVYFDDDPLVVAGLARATLDHSNYMHVILP
jgi:tetratricopeptide (TPR) repeat protein